MKYTTIPSGFVQIPWFKVIHNDDLEVFLNQVLKMVIRDYHIFYSIEKHVTDHVEVHFYCYPQYQFSVIYHIGVYSQIMLNSLTKDDVLNAIHRTPDGFPDCVRIDFETEKLKP